MKRGLSIAVTVSILGAAFWLLGGAPADEEEAKLVPQYVGAKGCRVCHKSKKIGNQMELWQESAHARAFTDLATPPADSIAAVCGVENPAESERCLRCHTTAFGENADLLASGYRREEGVQCEACHGPGSLYRALKVMMERERAVANGLWEIDETLCKRCHVQDCHPVGEFKYAERLGKIDHPVPKPDTTSAGPGAEEKSD